MGLEPNSRNKNPNSLQRYFSVIRNELPAKFSICKKTPIDVGPDSGIDELWEAHEVGLKNLKNLVRRIDRGETSLDDIEPSKNTLLDLKLELAQEILKSCHFCERKCDVNRVEGETGTCGVGPTSKVASEFVHYGEEPELIPSYTIFFSGCTFKCQFCQNWNISQNTESGIKTTPKEMSSAIEKKRDNGIKNVNWVGGDPTPNLPNILAALNNCVANIPSIWNSNMYLTKEGMKLLSGTQDIYLTDFKYGNDECALKYSKVPNYWEVVSRNHKIAFDDAELIIRHLVLPEHVECCTKKIIEWIKSELGQNVRVNLMDQYRPVANAREYPEISRRVSEDEMNRTFKIAEEAGMKNIVR